MSKAAAIRRFYLRRMPGSYLSAELSTASVKVVRDLLRNFPVPFKLLPQSEWHVTLLATTTPGLTEEEIIKISPPHDHYNAEIQFAGMASAPGHGLEFVLALQSDDISQRINRFKSLNMCPDSTRPHLTVAHHLTVTDEMRDYMLKLNNVISMYRDDLPELRIINEKMLDVAPKEIPGQM